MFAQSGGGWLTGVTAAIGLLGALLGVLKYFNYRTKRDRIAAVGSSFETVVEALASENDVKRLAAAIRLRRFFDPGSEVGIAGAAYAKDALGVTAGILREQPTGNFQKVLADGLAYAPSLVGADLQRTNLQGAYLGSTDVSRADFYRADLSHASLKGANCQEAVFYQSRLVDTVFTKADLRGANFFQADLTRARFGGALLADCSFERARSVPIDIAAHLDASGRFVGPQQPLVTQAPTASARAKVFVSRPSMLTASQEAVWRLVEETLAADAEVVTVARSDYPAIGVLADVHRIMAECDGVVILGFRQLVVSAGVWRPGTPEEHPADGLGLATPWNQVEAGIAAALGLPVLVVREPDVAGGIFDVAGDTLTIVAEFKDLLAQDDTRISLQRWVSEIPS